MDKSAYDLTRAHKHSIRNRAELLSSDLCGCFHCLSVFAPSEIGEFWDDEMTATCPRCGIDSVIGSSSGFPIETDFLRAMNAKWFDA